ncbi:MAG: TlpA family protein disulfide reductase, partial [Planctomycetes bacterium]|nr:TlpA family protein disulfide reductase [Planctomycetota bacterium]
MPHLNDLQSKHADDGVTIIAVTKEDSSNSLDKVKKMVQDKSDVMGYTVAWDDGSSTYEAYMTATGQRGIPTSFIIDPKGRLAFIGHPMELDEPLKRVIAGTWDPIEDGRKLEEAKAARRAMSKDLNRLHTASQHSVEGKGAGELLEMWKALAEKYPDGIQAAEDLHYRVLTAAGAYEDALPIGHRLVAEKVAAGDAAGLNGFAWDIVDPERNLAQRDLALALYAATVASNLEHHKNAPILDTLARA